MITVTDIVQLIDEATAPACGWCGQPLRPDGRSLDFCREYHQRLWHQHGAAASGRTVVGIDPAFQGATPQVVIIDEIHVMDVRLTVDWESLQTTMAAFVEAARVAVAGFKVVARLVNEAFESLQRTGVLHELPTDPKQRALELRRTRNTGPPVRQRAPRRIDATRIRR